jgi:hypothetical protein
MLNVEMNHKDGCRRIFWNRHYTNHLSGERSVRIVRSTTKIAPDPNGTETNVLEGASSSGLRSSSSSLGSEAAREAAIRIAESVKRLVLNPLGKTPQVHSDPETFMRGKGMLVMLKNKK